MHFICPIMFRKRIVPYGLALCAEEFDVQCDRCKRCLHLTDRTREGAAAIARRHGWATAGKPRKHAINHLCPRCIPLQREPGALF